MSKVLILTICSNHKVESRKVVDYQPLWRISDFLPEHLALRLYDARGRVRNLITSDKVSRNGVLLRDMPFNAHLIDGPDFQGKVEQGLYLPALQRYSGGFYKELGTTAERISLASHIKHHLVIVSGLYGPLTPTELIQCYSCHVPDHPDIAKLWTKKVRSDLLTSLLLAYIEKFEIVKVFDFMASDAYRNLISWEMIRHATQGNVLHCYSKQFAGGALLPSLGYLAKKFLTELSERSLLNIKAGQSISIPDDEITFLPFPMPEPPLVREVHEQKAVTSIADKMGRMRRNILRMLDVALRSDEYASFGDRVKELRTRGKRRDYEVATLIQNFGRIRNNVEYRSRMLSDAQWQVIRDNYDVILEWGRKNEYTDGIILEKVEL